MRTSRLIVAAGVVLLGVGTAAAQPPSPPPPNARPAFSPYLNLLRRENSPGVNYYGLVRPQLVAQQQFRAVQQQITAIQTADAERATSTELPVTGQPVVFLNTGGYFMNVQGGRGPAGPAVAGPRTITPITRAPIRTR